LSPALITQSNNESSESEKLKNGLRFEFDEAARSSVNWLSADFINKWLIAIVVILLVTFLWRLDWNLLRQTGMVTVSYKVGQQEQLYVAADDEGLTVLQDETADLSKRTAGLVDVPTTIIFTRMFNYYSITCVDGGGASEFITVHRNQLGSLTDAQLKACLK
jgi:hypothetical protein